MTLDPREVAAMLAGAEARRAEPLRPDTREEIQARLTTDPLSVALDAWHTACHEGVTIRQAMERVFAALSAAGLAGAPVAEAQYAIRYPESVQPVPSAGNPAALRALVAKVGGEPVRRVVGPWEPVPEDSGG